MEYVISYNLSHAWVSPEACHSHMTPEKKQYSVLLEKNVIMGIRETLMRTISAPALQWQLPDYCALSGHVRKSIQVCQA